MHGPFGLWLICFATWPFFCWVSLLPPFIVPDSTNISLLPPYISNCHRLCREHHAVEFRSVSLRSNKRRKYSALCCQDLARTAVRTWNATFHNPGLAQTSPTLSYIVDPFNVDPVPKSCRYLHMGHLSRYVQRSTEPEGGSISPR